MERVAKLPSLEDRFAREEQSRVAGPDELALERNILEQKARETIACPVVSKVLMPKLLMTAVMMMMMMMMVRVMMMVMMMMMTMAMMMMMMMLLLRVFVMVVVMIRMRMRMPECRPE